MLQPAPVQSTYIRYLTPAQNGILASAVEWAADSRIVETAAGIGFGLAVSQGTNPDGCVIGGSTPVGITRADPTIARADLAPGTSPPIDSYNLGDNAGVLVMGDIWVIAGGAVTVGSAVTFSTTTGQLGLAGTTMPNARWQTATTGAGQLAVVRLGNMAMR